MPEKWNGPYYVPPVNTKENSEKKIFVQDHTGKNPHKNHVNNIQNCTDKNDNKNTEKFILEKTYNNPIDSKDSAIKEESTKHSIEQTRCWKKMTTKKFILEKIYNNPMDLNDLAKQYIKGGYAKHSDISPENVAKTHSAMCGAIKSLKKEGVKIIKIKCGRYAIRKE